MNNERGESVTLDERLRAYAERRRHALPERQAMPVSLRERLHREIESIPPEPTVTSHAGWATLWTLLRRPWVVSPAVVLMLAGVAIWMRGKDEGMDVARQDRSAPSVSVPTLAPFLAGGPKADPEREASTPASTAERVSEPPRLTEAVPGPVPVRPAARPVDSSPVSAPPPAATTARRNASSPASIAPAPAPTVQVRYTQQAPVQGSTLLNRFRFEQAGDGLRIVDEDGSVYAAELRLASVPEARTIVAPVSALSTAASAASAAPPAVPTAVIVNAQGTNRGLQQRVSLAGRLIVTNVSGAPIMANQRAVLTNHTVLRFLLSNARLEGQAVVGSTNRFPILAQPDGNGP